MDSKPTSFRSYFLDAGIAFCIGVILYLLDKILFDNHFVSFAYGHASLWDRFVISYFRFELLRLLLTLVTGYVVYPLFDYRLRPLLLTWLFWVLLMFIFSAGGPLGWLWFLSIFFREEGLWRVATFIPFVLGPALIPRWPILQRVAAFRHKKVLVLGLGVVSLILITAPPILFINSRGYKSVRAMRLPTPSQAKEVKKTWYPRGGTWVITFDMEINAPESLLSFYDHYLTDWRPISHSQNDLYDVATGKTLKGIQATWISEGYCAEISLWASAMRAESSHAYKVMINVMPDSLTRQKFIGFL